jgi:hypothetical protein
MRRDQSTMNLKVFGIALAAVALAACSSRPTEPTASAPAPAAAPAAPAVAAIADPATGKPFVLNKTLIAAGFKATPFKGGMYYCRTEMVTGTSFKKKVCLDEAHLRELERQTQELQNRMMDNPWSPACQPFPECAT